MGNDYILGAVGVLQFDVTMARLKTEYGVDASYEPIDYAAARWIACDDKKRLAEFEKKCQANLALDADGHLTYLAASEWRLGFVMEEWPDIALPQDPGTQLSDMRLKKPIGVPSSPFAVFWKKEVSDHDAIQGLHGEGRI